MSSLILNLFSMQNGQKSNSYTKLLTSIFQLSFSEIGEREYTFCSFFFPVAFLYYLFDSILYSQREKRHFKNLYLYPELLYGVYGFVKVSLKKQIVYMTNV